MAGVPYTTPAVFLYGYQITALNSSIDFKANPMDATPRAASLRFGYYSLTSLLTEIARAISALDPLNTYTVTADRTVNGGTENRITITSSNTFFQLLFGTGPRVASSVAPLIGFLNSDYTGNITYTGSFTTGIRIVTALAPYNFIHPSEYQMVLGSVNIATDGTKEAIVYALQTFWQLEIKYETRANTRTIWAAFLQWAIQQRRLEYTPEIGNPTVFFEGTLEMTAAGSNGLGYQMKEMLPDFPALYQTGVLKFRGGPPS